MESGRLGLFRNMSRSTFLKGWPRHAAALIDEIRSYIKPTRTDLQMGAQLLAATYYGAYGELEKASAFLNLANSARVSTRSPTCRARDFYMKSRANAYYQLSTGEYRDTLSSVQNARKNLKINRELFGKCSDREFRQKWRDAELIILSAKALFHLGDLNKAENLALEVQKIPSYSGNYFKSQSLQLLGRIKRKQGRYQDALTYALLAKKDLTGFSCVPPDSPDNIETNRDIAIALTALNQFDEARQLMDRMKTELKPYPVVWNNLFAHSVDRGMILRETGDITQARNVFKAAVKKLSKQNGADHYLTREAALMGKMVQQDMPLAELGQNLKALLSQWQQRASQLTHRKGKQSIRLKWIVEDYLSRAFDERETPGVLGDAFEIAETLRSGMVQQALVQTALRRLVPDQAAKDLIRLQQDMQSKLGVMRQQLNDEADYGNLSVETVNTMKATVENTKIAVRQLTEQVRAAIPEYDQFVSSDLFNLDNAIRALKTGEAVVSLTTGRKESFVWVITSDGKVSGARIAKTADDWEEDVSSIRASMELPDEGLKGLFNFNVASAHKIYTDLLAPLEAHWGTADRLVFVSDNALSALPLGVFLRKPVKKISEAGLMFSGFRDLPWLIRTHAISVAPSLSSLVLLRQGTKTNTKRFAFLGMGDPVFNPDEAATELVLPTYPACIKRLMRSWPFARNWGQIKHGIFLSAHGPAKPRFAT